ncbi:hypothetical protein CAT7_07523 [Carnobacterium sp. AT7]|uniref:hypothetical protein n=1 Tax=Carnobacterium sp. AT7 TaxID=333990 RepID=UPI00015F10AD|nr:hypothetical protein [Carnobacterium sp. AT7]EDP68434.1 hypothetical protein CAT7_07523 [Carnobacterium sp. AT7]
MVRRSRDGEWKTPIPKPVIPVPENKKVHQVYCGTDEEVNYWLKNRPDIEVVDIKIAGTQDEELVMVVYKIELEEVE